MLSILTFGPLIWYNLERKWNGTRDRDGWVHSPYYTVHYFTGFRREIY